MTIVAESLTSSAQAIAAYGAMSQGPALQYLTPDALMAYCEAKMNDIDNQVNEGFQAQADRNDVSAAISEVVRKLSAHPDGVPADDQRTKDDVNESYTRAVELAGGPGTPTGAALEAERVDFQKNGSGTRKDGDKPDIGGDEVKGYSDRLGRMQNDINQSNELAMVKLQSLMSQRQQALQLCSNMVTSMDQSTQSVVSNVGK